MNCVLVYSHEVCCLHIVKVILLLVSHVKFESECDSDFMMKGKNFILPMLCFFICS